MNKFISLSSAPKVIKYFDNDKPVWVMKWKSKHYSEQKYRIKYVMNMQIPQLHIA